MNYLQTFESYSNYEKIDEGLMDFFSKVKSKFSGKEEEIKTELKDKLNIDENSSKEEVKSKGTVDAVDALDVVEVAKKKKSAKVKVKKSFSLNDVKTD